MLDQFKTAVYLDELHDDAIKASDLLKDQAIRYAVLRNVWGPTNICNATNDACKALRDRLDVNQQTTIAICSNLGVKPIEDLHKTPDDDIHHALHIAAYFKSPYVRIGVGTGKYNHDAVSAWMDRITGKCIDYNVAPIYEPTNESALIEPIDIISHLKQYKRWKLQYDPAQLILKKRFDPFVKYWMPLNKYVLAIDVRDFKMGQGFKPPGLGDAMIINTIKSAAANSYNGWLFLEPSLGRRYASAVSKVETFKLAMTALQSF